MILENHETVKFEEMWKFIGKILHPINMMPDKASLDYEQLMKLHHELKKMGNTSRDFIQVLILKNEVSSCLLQNLVN